ncbi:MAG: hypothetical protein U0269_12185 [Polyangiales bacterium]
MSYPPIIAATGIIPFLQAMANGTPITVPGEDTPYTYRDNFIADWEKSENSKHIKDKFRDATDGNHEWIPCNFIDEVLARANPAEGAKAPRWIDLQHQLRIPTRNLIMLPKAPFGIAQRQVNGKPVLCGHAGALYIATADGVEPLTENTNHFHNALRTAFMENRTFQSCIRAILAIFTANVWNGDPGALGDNVHKDYLDSGGQPINMNTIAGTQRTAYDAAVLNFTTCLANFPDT